MRKSTKLAILVAALVALCSLAAFAADTWKQEGDDWYCYDSDGNMVYGAWKKSGSNYYYLDDATGAMVKNQTVETDGKMYWCGADGARVLNQWVQVPYENDDDGWEWMYFKSVSGTAVGYGAANTGDFVTVNGKKYLFDTNGFMLYGFLADKLGTAADDAISANYYMGTKEDGSRVTAWMKFENGELEGEYADDALLYMYFKNGAKITDKDMNENGQYKINGKYYTFKSDGVMLYGVVADSASASYYGEADDGSFKKKIWVKTTDVEGGETERWYYFGSDGKLVVADEGTGAQVKKINSKYYLISTEGRLKSGLVVINNDDPDDPVNEKQKFITDDFDYWKDVTGYALGSNEHFYYFSTETDSDGTMKTGSQVISIDGEEKTLTFDKHGYAYEGVVSKKIYNNGILQTAGDSKYAVVALNSPDADYPRDYYLVNAAGSILKNTKVVDSDGIYWVAEGDYTDYDLFKFADREYAANAASAWKNGKKGFKISSQWYVITEDAAKSVAGKYTALKWEKISADPGNR